MFGLVTAGDIDFSESTVWEKQWDVMSGTRLGEYCAMCGTHMLDLPDESLHGWVRRDRRGNLVGTFECSPCVENDIKLHPRKKRVPPLSIVPNNATPAH